MNNNEIKISLNNSEMNKLFTELTSSWQKKTVINAMRMSSKPIVDEVKRNFNSIKKNKSKTNYKDFIKHLKVSPMKSKIGLLIGFKYYKARWIEYGTKERSYKTKKGNIKKTGKMIATNFFEKSVENTRESVFKSFETNVIYQMEKLVKKFNKK